MYILVITQSNGATIVPLHAHTLEMAKQYEAAILQSGGYTEDKAYNSEIIYLGSDKGVSQTYRDKNPMTGHAQEDFWEDRDCGFVPLP